MRRRKVKAKPKAERVFPATIVLELRDPKADAGPLEGLAQQLVLEGMILGPPAPVELRRSVDHPRRIEIPCTFPGVLESRRWMRAEGVRKYYGEELRKLLRRPPRVLAMRSAHDAEMLTCRCRRPKDLLLRANVFLPQSPLECGACRGALPAWRVDGQEVWDWALVYRFVDEIGLRHGPLARWADRQLSDPRSELHRSGRSAAQRAARAHRTRVFYWLASPEGSRRAGRCRLCRRPASPGTWTEPSERCLRCRIAF